MRMGMALIAGVMIVFALQGWKPPFSFREGQIPERDIIARVAFKVVNEAKTKADRDQMRRQALCIYDNDPEPIERLGIQLRNNLALLERDVPLEELSQEQREALDALLVGADSEDSLTEEETLTHLRALLMEHGNLDGGKLDTAIKSVLDPLSETGVITALSHNSDQGDQRRILVDGAFVDVAKIRRPELVASLPRLVSEKFEQTFDGPDAQIVAKIVSRYLAENLPKTTLTYRQDLSEEARRKAADQVQDAVVSYYPGASPLAEAGKPLSREKELPILRAEYEAWVASRTWGETTLRLLAFAGMLVAFFLLCGIFIHYQYDPELITDTPQLLRLLLTVVATCIVCNYVSTDPIRAEMVPLALCAMTLTIAFGRQVALLVTTCLALTVTLGLGLQMAGFVTLCSGVCGAALLLGRIRTRTRLIYVGLTVAAIVAATNLGVGIVQGKLNVVLPVAQAFESDIPQWQSLLPGLLGEAARHGGFALLAAATMTGLLPFIERAFGVQTDLSLLELGDASHVLLRQLAQRAPGTYNHSINVAAIAEAAADSIGAHGLLTRVGAYFHDIGKMFKPNYFIENQEQGGNRHDQLQPAMSTLVIIAHVKDGADLARQHHLPKRIIDFIEQHHGTTLVEYFFREAEKRSQEDPDRGEVSETTFRYPGPKPETLEAAVLMLADSVESASRTLVEPTPSRIQNLVDAIAMKKLLDGQFDNCGLTLQQLDQVKSSLVKSLTAIYHGRVKYSGQASA